MVKPFAQCQDFPHLLQYPTIPTSYKRMALAVCIPLKIDISLSGRPSKALLEGHVIYFDRH